MRPGPVMMFDIQPPGWVHGTAQPIHNPSPAARTAGIAVYDLFTGSYPQHIHGIVELPSVISVPVRGGAEQRPAGDEVPARTGENTEPAEPSGGRVTDELTFIPVTVVQRATPLDRDAVAAELHDLLHSDALRAEALAQHYLHQQEGQRVTIRAALGAERPHAEVLHQRVHAASKRTNQIPATTTRELPSRRTVEHARRQRRGPPRDVRVPEPPRALPARRKVPQRTVARAVRIVPHSHLAGLLVVGLGAFLFSGVTLFLGQTGSLGLVARGVRSTADAGVKHLLAGVRDLVTADAQAGTQNFSAARQNFAAAAATLRESISPVHRVAARLDPAGRLPAAQILLSVGDRAAVLGTEAAAVVDLFSRSTKSLTETLEDAIPKFSRLATGLRELRSALNDVPLSGLPAPEAATVQALAHALQTLDEAVEAFLRSEAVVLELLGSRMDRTYLVLFENSRELRPTGGFIGSFALVEVSRGEVRNLKVDTTYNPDGQLADYLSPPRPLQKITPRWFARDANWFADFRTSAQKVAHLFERSGGPTVDGVIAVTPFVLEDLLRFTGPIALPEYNVTVTAENVIAETQRLVTFDYDRARNRPKEFLTDLLPEVLARVASLPRERWGDLVDVFTAALEKKRILVYFRDSAAEDAIVKLGWAGAMPVPPASRSGLLSDHLGRVEANIGGHKTDLLIEQNVEYDVTLASDGSAIATMVVTRHHRGPKSGTPGLKPEEDPTRKPNIIYERTFAPLGSTLVDARGFVPSVDVPRPAPPEDLPVALDTDPQLAALETQERYHPSGIVVGRESGYTTFGGWIITEPEETTVTVLRYRLPFTLPRPSLLSTIVRYELLLTHQPGHLPVTARATLRVPEGFQLAWVEPQSATAQGGAQKVTYRAVVDHDTIWGAVLEER